MDADKEAVTLYYPIFLELHSKFIQFAIYLLKELRDSFLKKDIDEAGISTPDKFYALFSILAGQTGNLVNKHELAGNPLRTAGILAMDNLFPTILHFSLFGTTLSSIETILS